MIAVTSAAYSDAAPLASESVPHFIGIRTIRQDRLEEQLIGAIESRILNSNLIEYTLRQFQLGLQKRLDEMRRNATGLDELQRERQDLKAKADRLTNAI